MCGHRVRDRFGICGHRVFGVFEKEDFGNIFLPYVFVPLVIQETM
jgi:hypothetical protein